MLKFTIYILSFITNLMKFMAILCLSLAFLIIIYWMANVTDYNYMAFIAPFFDKILEIMQIFTIQEVTIFSTTLNLSYFYASAIFVILNIIFLIIEKFLTNTISIMKATNTQIKLYNEKKINEDIQNEIKHKLTFKGFLVKIEILNIKLIDINLIKESESKYNELYSTLENNNIIFSKKHENTELTLQFEDFDKLNTIIEILSTWRKSTPIVDCLMTLVPYKSSPEGIAKQVNKINNLKITNRIVTTSIMKLKYDLQYNQEYTLSSIGTYIIDDKEIEFYSFI